MDSVLLREIVVPIAAAYLGALFGGRAAVQAARHQHGFERRVEWYENTCNVLREFRRESLPSPFHTDFRLWCRHVEEFAQGLERSGKILGVSDAVTFRVSVMGLYALGLHIYAENNDDKPRDVAFITSEVVRIMDKAAEAEQAAAKELTESFGNLSIFSRVRRAADSLVGKVQLRLVRRAMKGARSRAPIPPTIQRGQ